MKKQYETIGGSPIRKWTEYQGKEMCKILDKACPESAPHKAYTAFRYADPLTEEALEEMKEDGVEHAIAFSQFPQWSCTTSGSSMNELWREVRRLNMTDTFRWSVIDRWPVHDGFVNAVVERIEERMSDFEVDDPNKVVVLFSAHSVPMKVVERGDHYVPEVAATVKKVMERWNKTNKYILGWQSKVGYVLMVPARKSIIKVWVSESSKSSSFPLHLLDHIETLFYIRRSMQSLRRKSESRSFVSLKA